MSQSGSSGAVAPNGRPGASHPDRHAHCSSIGYADEVSSSATSEADGPALPPARHANSARAEFMMMRPEFQRRLLVILLRLMGGVTVLAFPAMIMPTSWMVITHEWLGLGAFPETPVVDYLARSIAALYGFYGVLLFVISSDPGRYRRIVRYVGVMFLLFGVFVSVIDLHAGMPLVWTLMEGPPVVAFGVVVLYLSKFESASKPQS